jgi:ubiquinol-cytochrome c reductase cytochrome b subunit
MSCPGARELLGRHGHHQPVFGNSLVGPSIVTFLWGFAVGDPTLHRFYALHYLLPFVIVAASSPALGRAAPSRLQQPARDRSQGPQDTIPFTPIIQLKISSTEYFLTDLCLLCVLRAEFHGQPDSIPANRLLTPTPHRAPMVSPAYYAILRSITFPILFISSKLAG